MRGLEGRGGHERGGVSAQERAAKTRAKVRKCVRNKQASPPFSGRLQACTLCRHTSPGAVKQLSIIGGEPSPIRQAAGSQHGNERRGIPCSICNPMAKLYPSSSSCRGWRIWPLQQKHVDAVRGREVSSGREAAKQRNRDEKTG